MTLQHTHNAGEPAEPRRNRSTTIRKRRSGSGDIDAAKPYLILSALACGAGPPLTRILPVGEGVLIGRQLASQAGHLNLEDPLLSRRHAVVRVGSDGRAHISDLGSSNGTFVDGARINRTHPLHDGVCIFVGDNILCYRQLGAKQVADLAADAAAPALGTITVSAEMATVCAHLRALAPGDLEVLFGGESGVGKEVCARALHELSGRKGPFVAINCASLPEELLESELFGYARGAHSTATHSKPGLIERAEGGTLFLDEIADMSGSAQAKLLRFLQDRCFTPLGGSSLRRSDARVVAATRLAIAEPQGERPGLRPDLAARLGPDPLTVPPLRRRKEDIATLTENIAQGLQAQILPDALKLLYLYDWPSNVRELAKTLQLAAALAQGAPVGPEHLPAKLRQPPSPAEPAVPRDAQSLLAARRRRPRPSRELLMRLLLENGGDVAAVARAMGRQRTLVWRWLREHGYEVPNDLAQREGQ